MNGEAMVSEQESRDRAAEAVWSDRLNDGRSGPSRRRELPVIGGPFLKRRREVLQ